MINLTDILNEILCEFGVGRSESPTDIDFDEKFAENFYQEMDSEIDKLFDEYRYQTGDEENDIDYMLNPYVKLSDMKKSDPKLYDFLYSEFEDRFYDKQWELENVINPDGSVDIYRAMKVNDDYISHLSKEGKHLGIYWTYDERHAEAHWGNYGTSDVLLSGTVTDTSVDWKATLLLNMNYSLGDEEKEIRLYKGVPIDLRSIKIDGHVYHGDSLPKGKYIA